LSSVIQVENLSKQYRLGTVGTGSFSHDFNRAWHRIRGKEDPYLKIGEVNDRTQLGKSDYIWALKDINFEVKQGEVMGIIGRNGAGKSTLLKILSRTTSPSSGSVKIKGRVASLLEVGTGFHPELSGRDNIFLNGAILGMSKQEIKSKFDEIVDFSGVERYIDTPVKRYSSGMYVRLAFGVAAHLEPEILIVDEVLAVGDVEFQKKALGKMKEVSTKEGRTVLFVSHNMGAIRALCQTAIILKNGTTHYIGTVEDGVANYLRISDENFQNSLLERTDREGNGKFKFIAIDIKNEKGERTHSVFCNEKTSIEIEFNQVGIDLTKLIITVGFKDINNGLIAFFSTDEMGFILNDRTNFFMLDIPHISLRPSNYSIWLFASYETTSPSDFCDVIDSAVTLTILPIDYWLQGRMIRSRNSAFLTGLFRQ